MPREPAKLPREGSILVRAEVKLSFALITHPQQQPFFLSKAIDHC